MAGLIILAAGPSTRMGKPKQLLQYKGESLIRRSIRVGLEANCDPVIVVLGAHFDKIKPVITEMKVHIVENIAWEEGIGSSIRYGMSKLLKLAPETEDVIIMLCDQPMVKADLLKTLMRERKEKGKGIIACAYEETIGVPALFNKTFFPKLLALKGDEGAKKLLYRHRDEVVAVSFPAGAVDIDTIADYESLT
jgi:molybdenum cofactor cytidylyltransferase